MAGGFSQSLDIGKELEKGLAKQPSAENNPDDTSAFISLETVEKSLKNANPENNPGGPQGNPHNKKGFDFFSWKYATITLLLIPLIIGFFVLTQPASLKIIDERAEKVVEAELRQSALEEISIKYPFISSLEKEKLVTQKVLEGLKNPEAKKRKETLAGLYKNFYTDPNNQVYLYEVDTYLYARQAKNILQYNQLGNTYTNPLLHYNMVLPFDSLRWAPAGNVVQKTLLPYLEVGFFKLWNGLNPDVSLEKAIFYLPVVFGLLSIVCVFFTAKKITNLPVAFFVAFLFSVHQRFFVGNFAGFTDTQTLSFLFSNALMLAFVHAIDFKNIRNVVVSGLALIPLLLLYRFAWTGWFYILLILLSFVIAFVFFTIVHNAVSKRSKKYFGLLLIFVLICVGILLFINSSVYGQKIMDRLSPNPVRIFPSGLPTVSELKQSPIFSLGASSYVAAMGGIVIVLLAIIELVYLCYKNVRLKPNKYHILIITWLVPITIAGILSRRFLFYSITPFVLLIGVLLYQLFPKLVKLPEKFGFGISENTSKLCFTIIVPLLFLGLLADDLAKTKEFFPLMNDAYAKAGLYFQKETPADAIIANWWDLGYIWQYYANRATMLDSGLFETNRLYWISRAFTTNDEKFSQSIFRMLSCYGDYSASTIISAGKTPGEAVDFVEKLILMPKKDAFKALKAPHFFHNVSSQEGVGKSEDSQIHGFLNTTHCSPRETYVVLSEDDRTKISVMKNHADWDFKLGTARVVIKDLDQSQAVTTLINKFNISESDATELYFRAKGFKDEAKSYPLSHVSNCISENKVLYCANSYIVDLARMNATSNGLHPAGLIYFDKGKKKEVVYNDAKAGFTLIVFAAPDDRYQSFLIDSSLKDSMLVRLYGYDSFQFFEPALFTGEPKRIVVYKVLFNDSIVKN